MLVQTASLLAQKSANLGPSNLNNIFSIPLHCFHEPVHAIQMVCVLKNKLTR